MSKPYSSVDYYIGVHTLWKIGGNGGKRLTKKERIQIKKKLRVAKKMQEDLDRLEASKK